VHILRFGTKKYDSSHKLQFAEVISHFWQPFSHFWHSPGSSGAIKYPFEQFWTH